MSKTTALHVSKNIIIVTTTISNSKKYFLRPYHINYKYLKVVKLLSRYNNCIVNSRRETRDEIKYEIDVIK